MTRRWHRGLICLVWLASLAAVSWWLIRLGRGRLAAPPLGGPGQLMAWTAATGPVDACFALVRLACLVLVLYLAGTIVLELSAQLTGASLLRRLSDAVSLALVRRIVNGTIGMSVAAGALAAGTASASAVSVRPAAGAPADMVMRPVVGDRGGLRPAAGASADMVMRPVVGDRGGVRPAAASSTDMVMRAMVGDRSEASGSPLVTTPLPAKAALVMRPVQASAELKMRPVAEATASTMTMRVAAGEPAQADESRGDVPGDAVTGPSAQPSPAQPLQIRVLQPGDHLWAVAEQRVADLAGRAGTEQEVSSYWQRLVQLNRDELADRENPDLVFPGQIIRLPG